jgi:hypothetical protein
MKKKQLHTAVWIFFFVCRLVYLAAAIRDRHSLYIIGNICFINAVMIFLLPAG